MLDNHSINSLIFLCDALISTAVSHETLQSTHRQCLLLCDMHLWRNAFLHNYSHISRVTFSIYVFYCDRIIEPNNLKRKKILSFGSGFDTAQQGDMHGKAEDIEKKQKTELYGIFSTLFFQVPTLWVGDDHIKNRSPLFQ